MLRLALRRVSMTLTTMAKRVNRGSPNPCADLPSKMISRQTGLAITIERLRESGAQSVDVLVALNNGDSAMQHGPPSNPLGRID